MYCAVSPPKSECWKYFTRTIEGGRCNICQQIIKTAGNTTNLHFHLNRTHPKLQMKRNINQTSNTPDPSLILTKQKKPMVVINYFCIKN